MISRRDWIKSAVVGGAGVSLLHRALQASDEDAPLRFVVFYDHAGVTSRFARPRASGQADWGGTDDTAPLPTADNWELGSAYEPLTPYKDLILPISGLGIRSARVTQATAGGGGHGHLWTNSLTASPRIFHNRPGGASIDQVIADGLFLQGIVTPHHSLRVAVGRQPNISSPSFRPDGTNLPSMWAPTLAYDTILPEAMRASRTERTRLGEQWAAADKLANDIAAERQSKLVGDQLQRFQLHQELRAAHQDRLRSLLNVEDPLPNREDLLGAWQTTSRFGRPPDGVTQRDAWEISEAVNTELVALSLHLDLTRVAVIKNDWLPYELWQPSGDEAFVGSLFGEDDHAFHHSAVKANQIHGARGESYMLYYHQRTMGPLRMLLDKLQSRTDSDGCTVLDNTVVLIASEMASAAHDSGSLQWSMLYGTNAAQRLGVTTGEPLLLDRLMPMQNNPAERIPVSEWRGRPNHQGHSNAQLFRAIANGFGIDTAFGPDWLSPSALDLNDPAASIMPPLIKPA